MDSEFKKKANDILVLVKKEAQKRRDDAGWNGSWSDNGADALERNIEFFRAGMEGRIPEEWKSYEAKLDPEYIEYLRLKAKFGGK